MKWNVECRTVEGRSKSYVWWLAGMMWLFSSAFLLQACHSEGDGHDHGHEEAEAEKHDDHEGLIVFEPEQARAAGLQVEVMKRAPFHAVIDIHFSHENSFLFTCHARNVSQNLYCLPLATM